MTRNNLIFVRVTDEEKEKIKEYAKSNCRSVSSLILFCVHKEIKQNS